jgi:signal transduction histidine kinase
MIAAAGYQGVEFAQRPETLGDLERLLRFLRERDLEFLGLAGGMLWERVEYCGTNRPHYLYVEDWHPIDAPQAIELGFVLALHPHVYKRVHRLSDARYLLEAHPELRWLPDTAHLTIAGDHPVDAMRVAADRMIGIHLKDWKAAYGRSSHRYSRGFTELGEGDVDLESVVGEVRSTSYDNWLIVEQDCTRTDAQNSLFRCAEWLWERNILSSRPRRAGNSNVPLGNETKSTGALSRPAHQQFNQTIAQSASERAEDRYNAIASAFSQVVPSRAVTVWACSPADDVLSLLAAYPSSISSGEHVQTSGSLSGITIERQRTTRFDLTDPQPGAPYHRPSARAGAKALIDQTGATEMVSVPLLNPYNANHVRALVNLFPCPGHPQIDDNALFLLGTDAAHAADETLDDLCSFAAGSVNLLAGRCKQVLQFATELVRVVQSLVDCEACSLFLVDETERRLEVIASTTDLIWNVEPSQRFYERGKGLTGRVWARNEAILTPNARQSTSWLGKSAERVKTPTRDACLLVPLVNAVGKVLGVFRCRNKRSSQQETSPQMFSDNDAALIDAISQAALPHLQILLSDERRAKAVMRLMHELRTPLVAIRGASEWIDREIRAKNQDPANFFRRDYLGDLWSWTELMRGLLLNAQFYGLKAEPVRVEPSPHFLMADVIAPSVRQVAMLLRQQRFSTSGIRYGSFEQVPRLWIDKNQFHQVFFNLLSNAIKYAFHDPGAFQVEIDGARRGGEFIIWCRDWGTGVPDGFEKAIFQEGVRAPGASDFYVGGQGLGLWVAQQIIQAHGGDITLTQSKLPTEFAIRLPGHLARYWSP